MKQIYVKFKNNDNIKLESGSLIPPTKQSKAKIMTEIKQVKNVQPDMIHYSDNEYDGRSTE